MRKKKSVWKIVDIKHLGEIKEEIRSKVRDGLLDKGVYNAYLSGLTEELPQEARGARSIVIAAFPQPSLGLTFHYGGKALKAVVPSTYFSSSAVADEVKSELKSAYGEGSEYVRAFLPLKLISVRGGLASYGRNNLIYVPGLGSFIRLTSFFSNVEPEEDTWSGERMMEECKGCWRCVDACPAGVLGKERFMARAERCLAYMNEKPSAEAFPAWVKPAWHNAIVGCMICQSCCPVNKGGISRIEDCGEFSEEETTYLLKGDFAKENMIVKKKLEDAGLDLSIFPRNLKALVERDRPQKV